MATPTYTQVFETYTHTGFTDGQWVTVTDGSHASVVLEIIMENIQAGTENQTGVRSVGGVARIIDLHEAEGGGNTHCRMFVQTNASSQFDVYAEDYTDAVWYIVGYWSNVTFTEAYNEENPSGTDNQFNDQTLNAGASCVHHILGRCISEVRAEAAITVGARAKGSALSRSIVMHEAEAGGYTYLDFLVKADASSIIEVYKYLSGSVSNLYYDLGYFSSELDFVEKWYNQSGSGQLWYQWDFSAYLDQDGRVCDFMLVNGDLDATYSLGVRDGDDSATERKLLEHEAEGVGADNSEFTGFSMSAKSNSTGLVYCYLYSAGGVYLAGYFKPSGEVLLAAYNSKSLRRPNKVDLYYGETSRLITILSSYIGKTVRGINSLSSYTGKTYRSIQNQLSYIGKTIRKPSKLADYIGKTKRNISGLANYAGETTRNIWGSVQYLGRTLRKTSIIDTIVYETSRYIGAGLSYVGKTTRNILGAANYIGKTIRGIRNLGQYLSKTYRKLGVDIVGLGAPQTEQQTTTSSSYYVSGYSTDYRRVAQEITFSGKTLNSLTFYINKVGIPPGNAYFRVRDLSDNVVGEVGFLANSLSTSYTWVEYELNSPVYLNGTYRICYEYGEGNVSNFTNIRYNSASVKSNEELWRYVSSWAEVSSQDLGYKYTYQTGGGTLAYTTSRLLTKALSYIGKAVRSLSGLSNYVGSTSRNVVTETIAEYYGKTVRYVNKLADYAGKAYRYVGKLSDYVGKTYRYVSKFADYLGDTSRYVSQLADYVGKTARIVTVVGGDVATYLAKTGRQVVLEGWWSASEYFSTLTAWVAEFLGSSLRVVLNTATYLSKTRRILGIPSDYFGMTQRNISKLAQYLGNTIRNINKLTTYLARTVRNVGKIDYYLGETARIITSTANYFGRTVRNISKLAQYVGKTYRSIGSLAQYLGRTLREVYILGVASYGGATLRKITSLASMYGVTSRYVVLLSYYAGSTSRSIANVAQYLGRTFREVVVLGIGYYNGQTLRQLVSMTSFSGATARYVTTMAYYVGRSLRSLRSLALFAGETVRRIGNISSYVGKTIRRVTLLSSYYGKSLRRVIGLAYIAGQTRRYIYGLTVFTGRSLRRLSVPTEYVGKTARILYLFFYATFYGQTNRIVRSLSQFFGQTRRDLLSRTFALIDTNFSKLVDNINESTIINSFRKIINRAFSIIVDRNIDKK